MGKVFTSKSVGTGPSSCGKNNLPGRGLTKVEKHWCTVLWSSDDTQRKEKRAGAR